MQDLNNEIKSFLTELNDFDKGILLLSKISDNRHMLFRLQRDENEYSWGVIKYELSEHLLRLGIEHRTGQHKLEKPVVEKKPEPAKKASKKIEVAESELEPVDLVSKLMSEKKATYNERNKLSQFITDSTAELEDAAETMDDVKSAAKALLELDEKIKELDEQIEYAMKHGKAYEAPVPPPQVQGSLHTTESLQKEINNMQSRLSRARGKFNKSQTPGNAEAVAKIEHELLELREKRKIMLG